MSKSSPFTHSGESIHPSDIGATILWTMHLTEQENETRFKCYETHNMPVCMSFDLIATSRSLGLMWAEFAMQILFKKYGKVVALAFKV